MPTFRGQIVDRQILLTVHVSVPGNPDDPASKKVEAPRALLDTGATISGISERLIKLLELPEAQQWETVGGVHGTEDVPLYEIDLHLPISEASGEGMQTYSRGRLDLQVIPINVQSPTFDVLLGMDFLEDFHLTIHGDIFILSN